MNKKSIPVPQEIPRGTFSARDQDFKNIISAMMKVRRQQLEKTMKKAITKALKEEKDQIKKIVVTNNHIVALDECNVELAKY